METNYLTAEDAFLDNLHMCLQEQGNISPRGLTTKELLSRTISISRPECRCYYVSGRNDNIFAKIAETLWMLNGQDDITWLSYYLPRAVNFSDNGSTWRGAYGPRLRNWNGHSHKVDQIEYVIKTLLNDVNSRQAVISIWDPSEDTIPVTKDRPCNNWLNFYIRNNYLHMNVAQRSCDLFWGYSGIDTFSWSVLQQMMAYWTGSYVGTFTHFISSLHLYDTHWNKAQTILNTWRNFQSLYTMWNLKIAKFSTPFEDFDTKVEHLLDIERNMRIEPDQYELELFDKLEDDFLALCGKMLFAFVLATEQAKRGNISWHDIGYVISTMPPNNDFRLSAIEYFTRKDSTILKYISITDTEHEILEKIYQRL